MKFKFRLDRTFLTTVGYALALGLAGCATDYPADATAGPGIETPAAATSNNVIPAIGTAGNGGGISGGGAGSAVSH